VTAATQLVVSPVPARNQVDAAGVVSGPSLARSILESHMNALQARRAHDLQSEKLLLHIDGAGDFQWADIYEGQRVAIPPSVSEFRKSENLLRPVVDNAVAHHTTMPLQYFAKTRPDRASRERGLIDTLWANHLTEVQDLNGVFADALYTAMPAGFCTVHAYWRDDAVEQHEPSGPAGGPQLYQPSPGMIDCWVGNPWDTVFDRAAKRGSINWASYARVLPADAVRSHFGHIPGVAGIQGTTRMPSSAAFQRIARSWRLTGLGIHGHPVKDYRQGDRGAEELLIVVCRESLPGVDPRFPDGRLQMIAVPEASDLRARDGNTSHAILLADQPLPGLDFSFTLFYSHHRGEDVEGKPWVEDMDALQIDLNIALSKRWEYTLKMANAPIVAPGGAFSEDMMVVGDGYDVIEVEPGAAGWRPSVMQWDPSVLQALSLEIREKRSAIYTLGGYQAASRGEAPGSRIAAKAIEHLQRADSTVHGPVNVRFRRAACDFMGICWKQFKQYGDVPWLLEVVGDEFGYLVEPYVDKTKVSSTPPNYRLVNAFGTTPEQRGQEVLDLMARRGADGQVFLTTEAARRAYPDQMLFGDEVNPRAVARRRAKTIATHFHTLARRYREQTGFEGTAMNDPGVQQAAQWVFMVLESKYPRMRDDDLNAHIAALSEITQDETADAIARIAAVARLNLYFQWQMQMAQPAAMTSGRGQLPPGRESAQQGAA